MQKKQIAENTWNMIFICIWIYIRVFLNNQCTCEKKLKQHRWTICAVDWSIYLISWILVKWKKQKTFFIYTVVQNSQNNTVKIYNHDFSFCLLQDDEYPTVLVSLFFEQPTPFAEDFLERIANLKYPKSRIDLFIHNKVSCW